MKNDLIGAIITSNQINNKNNPNSCSICKYDNLPINFSKNNKNEIKILITKFKFKESDFSVIIKKCKCSKNPKAHKLCIILDIIYNFNLKCKECNADYNIVINQQKNTLKKVLNICSLIYFLFLNLIIYGVCFFLILYPLIINKNDNNDPEKNKFEHIYYFFGGLIFIINTFFIFVVVSSIIYNNSQDTKDYYIDIKDINEPNTNKNTDKYYNILYKFYRYFYKTQIRFLIDKKYKSIYFSKGNANFNNEIKDIIIKNNIECEKEQDNILNNGGDNILNINKNKNKNKSSNIINKNENENDNEQSNGNISSNAKRQSSLIEEVNKKKEYNNKESKNNTGNLPQVKNNNTLSNNSINNINNNINVSNKKNNDLITNGSEIQEREKKNEINKKKEIIEVINTDIDVYKNEKGNLRLKEENKNNEENENENISINNISRNSKNSRISKNSKKLKKNYNSKTDISRIKFDKNIKEESKIETNSQIIKDNDKKYIESTELFKNDNKEIKIEDNIKTSQNELIAEPAVKDDNFNFLVSSPFHNIGK